MAAPPRTERAPRKLLLATDLSARCDRALDRAVSLAGGWQAGLVALHVLEQPEEFYAGELERRLPSWRRPPERARIVEEQLRHDLVQAFPGVAVVLETGDVADAIVRVTVKLSHEQARLFRVPEAKSLLHGAHFLASFRTELPDDRRSTLPPGHQPDSASPVETLETYLKLKEDLPETRRHKLLAAAQDLIATVDAGHV